MLLGFRHTLRTGYVPSKYQIEANVGSGAIPCCCWEKRLQTSPQQLQRGIATDGRVDIHCWTSAIQRSANAHPAGTLTREIEIGDWEF